MTLGRLGSSSFTRSSGAAMGVQDLVALHGGLLGKQTTWGVSVKTNHRQNAARDQDFLWPANLGLEDSRKMETCPMG